jgi:DNA polymerase (family 10)
MTKNAIKISTNKAANIDSKNPVALCMTNIQSFAFIIISLLNFKNSDFQMIDMINQEIAEIFEAMADILEIKKVPWKPIAYRAAARTIKFMPKDVKDIYKEGGIKALEDIPGVGERLAEKIVEYIKTKKVKEYERLKKTIPAGLSALMNIPGLGPKKAYVLYKKLKIKSISDLKKALEEHKVRKIFGFGEKSEEKIEESVEETKAHKQRFPLNKVFPVASKIIFELKKLKEVEKIEAVGSLRRKELTIGDIDILTVSKNPGKVMNAFTSLPLVKKIVSKGQKKSQVILKNGMQADLRVFDKKSFGAAMQYFTGNKEHNVALRRIAIKKGYKLNEYGLYEGNKLIAGETEKDVYNALGLKWIPPEKRKNEGEIEEYQL